MLTKVVSNGVKKINFLEICTEKTQGHFQSVFIFLHGHFFFTGTFFVFSRVIFFFDGNKNAGFNCSD